MAAIAFSLNTLILTIAIWDSGERLTLIGWQVAFQVISALQILGWWRHRDSPRPTFVSQRVIVRSIGRAIFLSAMLGVFAATNFPSDAIDQQLVIGFVIIGTAAGSVVALYPVPAAAFSFVLLCVFPPLVVALSFGETIYQYVAALSVVFVSFLLLSARRAYLIFVDAMEQKLENVDLMMKAQAANHAKSMFLAKMSHELRTPLNAVIGFSDIMENEMFGPIGAPQYADYMKSIGQSGGRLLELVENILDISNVEFGAFALDEEDIDIAGLLESCISRYAKPAYEAKLSLETDIAEHTPWARVDARRLEQIVSNLLDNAIKFTHSGGSVRLSARLDDDGGLEVSVADTGIGIADDELARTQTAFGQFDIRAGADEKIEDSHIARDGEGAGLGLALARALAESHGGTLDIDSKRGSGTTVRITLPAERTLNPENVVSSAM